MSPVTELEAKQAAIIEAQAAKIKAQAFQIDKLIAELLLFKNRLFGRSREAADLLGVQGQLFAPPDVVEVASAVVLAPILPRTPKTSAEQKPQQARREVISPDLPREVRLLDLPESEKVGLVKIGEDTSERLSYTPGTIIVLQTIRPRYADPKNADAGVQQMPVLPSIIPGGILDESVITEFAINKFADHIPLSRSIDRFGRLGVKLALSTISENLLTTATVWLNPMVDAL